MAHYDLYQSIGLDRSKDPETLGWELDQRMQAGNPTNPGGVEELWIARSILGDAHRRSMYDQRLNDPYAPEITVEDLRGLANTNMSAPVETRVVEEKPAPEPASKAERPRQHFPDTDPNMTPVYAPQYEQPVKKKAVWPWVLGGVLLLGAAGAGGYWWYTQNGGPTEPWEGENAAIAEAFPDLVSAEDGGRGFKGMTCRAKEAEGDETGKIRCASPDAGVSIFKFDSAEARDASLPQRDDTQRFGNDNCVITSTKVEGQDLPTYFIAPDGEYSHYSFLVNGNDAEKLRLQLPIC